MLELNSRLAEFDLEAEPTKTGLLCFGDKARARCKQEGLRRPQTFNFLGLTHFVGRSRGGRFVVGRKTQRERAQGKLKAVSVRLADLRTHGGKAMVEYVQHISKATSSITESVATVAVSGSTCIKPGGFCSHG